jgi:hypothetical protein
MLKAAFLQRSLGLGLILAFPLLAGAKGGCSSDEVPIGSDGEACGTSTCQEGEFCCNESCGICAPKGGGCIQLFCEPEPDSGVGGVQCGNVTCAPGQECCNESCGICVEPGGACIQVECEDRTPASGICVKNSNDACTTDADCISGGCGGELCFNPAVSDGVSTCECTAPAFKGCGCVSGQCTWYN